ncbi:cytochrome c oxidase subunit 6a, mitochondrial-like [Phoenix dactylifera]|uniref:Cytochrome c oxidase subunit 6a, mitochondrial-like n=1 Tax=Phoenix dactylifera TaxID=42345 RepID=A0A8B9B1I6_PHODC|nr:cytochrome c oxidase subunit 6a, mitochondrial-like [Phoenix dactylifera]
MAMSMSAGRCGLRALLRGGARRSDAAAGKRSFSASAHQDDAYETAKWEKITYAGIVTCTVLSIYNLSKDHPHHLEPPAYEYLHVRNKEFPWGPDGLFEKKHAEH